MFDIGWSEMAVILLVALIVIGPKDLPKVARQIGKWTAKARGMAREFQRSLDDMAREAELQDIKAEMDKLSRTDMRRRLEETVDPEGELRRGLAPPAGRPLTPSSPEPAPTAELPPPPPAPPPPTAAVPAVTTTATTAAEPAATTPHVAEVTPGSSPPEGEKS